MNRVIEFFQGATMPQSASAMDLAQEHLRARASRLFCLYIQARDYGDTDLAARLIARAMQYEDEAASLSAESHKALTRSSAPVPPASEHAG
jgi:hypothetical protein